MMTAPTFNMYHEHRPRRFVRSFGPRMTVFGEDFMEPRLFHYTMGHHNPFANLHQRKMCIPEETFNVDCKKNEDGMLEITAALPGFEKDDVSIEIKDNALILSVRKTEEKISEQCSCEDVNNSHCNPEEDVEKYIAELGHLLLFRHFRGIPHTGANAACTKATSTVHSPITAIESVSAATETIAGTFPTANFEAAKTVEQGGTSMLEKLRASTSTSISTSIFEEAAQTTSSDDKTMTSPAGQQPQTQTRTQTQTQTEVQERVDKSTAPAAAHKPCSPCRWREDRSSFQSQRRVIQLPKDCDQANISAALEDGVLRILAPCLAPKEPTKRLFVDIKSRV
jgi:HSP20 family molecular chaperone IbpA